MNAVYTTALIRLQTTSGRPYAGFALQCALDAACKQGFSLFSLVTAPFLLPWLLKTLRVHLCEWPEPFALFLVWFWDTLGLECPFLKTIRVKCSEASCFGFGSLFC